MLAECSVLFRRGLIAGGKGLTVCKCVVADVVAGLVRKVEDQRGNPSCSIPVPRIRCLAELLETDGYCDEDGAHQRRGEHEHVAAPEPRDDQGGDGGSEQTPAVVGEVDSGLCEIGGIPHHAEEEAGVVREQRVAGHLGEEAHHRRDEDATAHAGGFDHVPPGLLGVVHLDGDGRLDLSHFRTGEQRVRVALGVVLDQDGKGFVVAILADQPTRAFW